MLCLNTCGLVYDDDDDADDDDDDDADDDDDDDDADADDDDDDDDDDLWNSPKTLSLVLQNAYESTQPEVVCQCLEVVGKYVGWIDINLVANDQFVPVLLRFLSLPLLREAAADCIYEVMGKGMDPVAKLRLVQSFCSLLESAGVLNPPEVRA
jgi:hypothetical protein